VETFVNPRPTARGDAFLLEVSSEVVEAALARPDAPNLDRGSHREDHLDRVEQALAGAGYA
jgi:hypothetical protein